MQRMTDYFARLICIILAAFVLTSPLAAYAEYDAEHPELLTEDDITAEACILIEQTTGNDK